MTLAGLAWPLAAALFAGDLPDSARIARLTPYFSPPPGREVQVEARAVRDLAKTGRLRPERLRGFIVVAPPKGVCLTIERTPDTEDTVVCKRTTLSFTVDELDRAGRLTWRVTTGDGDFGTTLEWRSPYRRAIFVPFSTDGQDEPEPRYVDRCDAEPEPGHRRLTVTMLTGETVTVRFEDQDELYQPQPPAPPSLYVAISGANASKTDEDQKPPATAAPEGKGEATEETKEPAPPAPKPAKAPPESEDRRDWAVGRRGSYVLSANHLLVHGSPTPGLTGQCRYNYHGPADDPDTGRLECHDADGYKLVYLPLPCLVKLRPAPQAASQRK